MLVESFRIGTAIFILYELVMSVVVSGVERLSPTTLKLIIETAISQQE
jgi:hypothetical protein